MGVIRTDRWLEEYFLHPIEICRKFQGLFDDNNPKKIYEYLVEFGMYKPNSKTKYVYEKLKDQDVWGKIERIFQKYRRKWNGPNIPIYIFPINEKLFRQSDKKSGVSFPDKMFLFVSILEDDIELEALFIHEYHHVCRIQKQNKPIKEYTLLDSIVLEGLAEHAVKMHCGEKYNADWCNYYTNDELSISWKRYVKPHLKLVKSEIIHDQILFGYGKYPKLIGYALGFQIISYYSNKTPLSIKASFLMESETFLQHYHSRE